MPTDTPEPTEELYFSQPGKYIEELVIDEIPRWYLVSVPESYKHGDPTPLVFNFHGAGMSFGAQNNLTGTSELGEKENFIAVIPQGLSMRWQLIENAENNRDLAFVDAILDDLDEKLTIDEKRIFAVGLSNGGGFVDGLGCYRSDRFAAIGTVAGAYLYWATCEPDHPISVITIHGTADDVALYSGKGFSMANWAGDWAERSGCDPSSEVVFDEGNTVGEAWGNCEGNAEVIMYSVDGGGHTWFGNAIGTSPADINSMELIWAFFDAHPKP